MESSSGICGCWEGALRDRDDRLVLENRRNVLETKAFAVIFLADQSVLCIFVLL